MPDPTPNINETQIGIDLSLALASLYLSPDKLGSVQKGEVALNALLSSLALYRDASGRPAGWVPSAEDWAAFEAEIDDKIAAEESRLASIPKAAPEDPAPAT